MIYAVPRNDPNTMYIGINDRDKAWHDLYKLDIATGQKTLLRQNTERIAGWIFDNAGNGKIASTDIAARPLPGEIAGQRRPLMSVLTAR